MTRVSVEVRVMHNQFGRLARMSFTPSYARMSTYFARELGNMFETEGASRGHPWQPLSTKYAEWKAREGRSPKILHLTGELRAFHGVLSIGPEGLVYGWPDNATDPAGKPVWHDSGNERVPERPLIRIIPRDIEEFARLLREQIETTAGGDAP